MRPRNRFQGMNSASLCSLVGRYDNPLPPRFLAPIDSLKIPALLTTKSDTVGGGGVASTKKIFCAIQNENIEHALQNVHVLIFSVKIVKK
jgi:hypothetical protein